MVTRAIAPPGDPVNRLVPGARNAAPAATTAQIAISTARTRQKVSLRRIRRRSTMVSASSDMAHLLRRIRPDRAVARTRGQPHEPAAIVARSRTRRVRDLGDSVLVLLVRGLVAAL